jgi:hypothetical protein
VQNGAALFHDLARHAHLRFKFRVVRGDAQAVGGFGDVQLVAFFELQARQQLFGKDGANRVADSG